MHILHILDHSLPLHSGYSFRTKSIIEQQGELGWQTSHITSTKQGLTAGLKETASGLEFYRTQYSDGIVTRLPMINQLAVISSLGKRLREVVVEVQPDILHAHSPALNGAAALGTKKALNIPLVYEVRAFWEDAAVDHGTSKERGIRYQLTRALETYVLRRADAVITICEGLRKDIISRGISRSKVTVVPNGVNIDQFHGVGGDQVSALKNKLGLQDCNVLGFIGSFYAYEGLAHLLHALPRILLKVPNTRVLLVGGGPEQENLVELVKQMDIAEQVIFTGRVAHDKVKLYYDLMDILVYPRLPMRLTNLVTPLKPLEAMALGRLVIASDVGGHQELIRNGETGQLFAAGKTNALAAATIDMLRHRERWPAQRVAARRFVEHERQWRYVVERYRKVYEGLVNR